MLAAYEGVHASAPLYTCSVKEIEISVKKTFNREDSGASKEQRSLQLKHRRRRQHSVHFRVRRIYHKE